ncbi:hypothetical protein YM116_2012 [Enterococcus faecalis]|nr:hypothetical protein YM116_2012 [Enterococcus faecalis]
MVSFPTLPQPERSRTMIAAKDNLCFVALFIKTPHFFIF